MKAPSHKTENTVNTVASQINREVTVVSQVNQEDLDQHMFGVEVIPPITLDRGGDSFAPEPEPVEAQKVENLKQVSENTKGAVTSSHVDVNALRPQDVDDILSASIIARPMNLPDYLDQRAKDPNYRLRWVNFKVNGGSRYEQLKAAGFRNAKPEEVVGLNGALTQDASGIRYNDTILMIIKAELLLGAYKYNFIRSQAMTSRKGSLGKALEVANGEMLKHINAEHISATYLQDPNMGTKVNFYTPGEQEAVKH